MLPFGQFTGAKWVFDPSVPVEKIELQPGHDPAGNALLLGEFMSQK